MEVIVLFSSFKNVIKNPNLNPHSTIIDLKKALVMALSAGFLRTKIKDCFFSFSTGKNWRNWFTDFIQRKY